jgi:hypothetical protein
MTRRVVTTAVTMSWPASRTSACWPATVSWRAGTVLEVPAGSALETAIGLGNLGVAADADVSSTRGKGTTSN